MTKVEATNFHKDMNAAVETVLRKYNLDKAKTSVRFSGTEVKYSLEADILNTDGSRKADPAENYLLICHLEDAGIQNIPKQVIGAKVRVGSSPEVYTIVGCNIRAPKFPVQLQNSKGQNFKAQAKGIRFI